MESKDNPSQELAEPAEAVEVESAGAETPPDATGQDPSGTDQQAEVDEVFRLQDVPEEIREPVERLQKQMQSALTRARQADRAKVQEAEKAVELLAALNDPERAAETLEALAEELGYEPSVGSDEEAEEPEGSLDNLPPELTEKLGAIDQLTAAEEQRKHERRVQIVRAHVEDGLSEMAGEGETVSDDVRELYTLAALAHRGEDGLPNTQRAGELVEAVQAAAVQRHLDRLRRQQGAPDASGSSGVSHGDTSTPEGRRAMAEKIAARHLGAGV